MKKENVRFLIMMMVWILLSKGLPIVSADLFYNDGKIHNISTDYSGDIGHVHNKTTVNVYTGGAYDELYVWDYSAINFFDGIIHEIIGACNYSNVAIHDGWIDKVGVNSVSGGSGDARVDIFGGSIVQLQASGGHSYVDGGSIMRVVTDDSAWVSISDGSIGEINAYSQSQVEIVGGYIGGDLFARSESVITIYGTGFNYDYGSIDATFGTLQGTLTSGHTINADFYIYSPDASIVLVPEPATLLLLGLGAVMVRRKRKV